MSLDTWHANGWLARHTASAQEIGDLVDAAAQDLADAKKDRRRRSRNRTFPR
jgi:hypothetical protein